MFGIGVAAATGAGSAHGETPPASVESAESSSAVVESTSSSNVIGLPESSENSGSQASSDVDSTDVGSDGASSSSTPDAPVASSSGGSVNDDVAVGSPVQGEADSDDTAPAEEEGITAITAESPVSDGERNSDPAAVRTIREVRHPSSVLPQSSVAVPLVGTPPPSDGSEAPDANPAVGATLPVGTATPSSLVSVSASWASAERQAQRIPLFPVMSGLVVTLGISPKGAPVPASPIPLSELLWAAGRTGGFSGNQGGAGRNLSTPPAPTTLAAAEVAEEPNYSNNMTINLGGTPTNVTLSSGGTRGFAVVDGSVRIIDIGADGPVVRAVVPVGSNPSMVASSADGSRAFVTNSGDGTVSIIELDALTGQPEVTTVGVGSGPTGIAVNSAGTRAYVADTSSGTVSIIDYATPLPFGLPTQPKVTTANVGAGPSSVATNTAGTTAYVTNTDSNTVSIINYNGSGNPSISTVNVSAGPSSVKASEDGTKAIVYSRNGVVSIIDSSGAVPVVTVVPGAHVSYADSPGFVGISADGTTAYVTEHDSMRVAIIDTAKPGEVPTYVTFPDYPHSIAVLRSGDLAFTVAHDALYVIDTNTGQASAVTIPANNDSSQFQRVAISRDGGRLIAVDNSGNLTAFYYTNSSGSDSPSDENIRQWLRNLGPLLAWGYHFTDSRALGALGPGIDSLLIVDAFSEGGLPQGLYVTAQTAAANLEFLGLRFPPLLGVGLALDTLSYAVNDTYKTYQNSPPADATTLVTYIAQHPGGAWAGAQNGVLGMAANVASHFLPEVVVRPVAQVRMDENNARGDAFDQAWENVWQGRLPWETGS